MTKKVLFIDWNKTLSYSLFWEHLQDEDHPNHKYLSAIEKWLFVDNQAIINQWMRGDLSVYDVVERMGRDTNISSELILEELRQSCEKMSYSVNTTEKIIKKIKKRNIRVVIATDNMDIFSRFTVPAMKLNKIFDDILNSYDIGHLKDDSQPADRILFFDEYLTKNGWNYADAILLDDSPDKSGKYKKLRFDRIMIDSSKTLKQELERFVNVI